MVTITDSIVNSLGPFPSPPPEVKLLCWIQTQRSLGCWDQGSWRIGKLEICHQRFLDLGSCQGYCWRKCQDTFYLFVTHLTQIHTTHAVIMIKGRQHHQTTSISFSRAFGLEMVTLCGYFWFLDFLIHYVKLMLAIIESFFLSFLLKTVGRWLSGLKKFVLYTILQQTLHHGIFSPYSTMYHTKWSYLREKVGVEDTTFILAGEDWGWVLAGEDWGKAATRSLSSSSVTNGACPSSTVTLSSILSTASSLPCMVERSSYLENTLCKCLLFSTTVFVMPLQNGISHLNVSINIDMLRCKWSIRISK